MKQSTTKPDGLSKDSNLNTQRIRIKLDSSGYSPPKQAQEKSSHSQGNSTDNLGERTHK